MRIRFLEDTHIRLVPDTRTGKPIGVLLKGAEIVVEPVLAKGEAIMGNDRWYYDKNGWYYWSGRVDAIAVDTDDILISSTIGFIDFPDFISPNVATTGQIPAGETRRLPRIEELIQLEHILMKRHQAVATSEARTRDIEETLLEVEEESESVQVITETISTENSNTAEVRTQSRVLETVSRDVSEIKIIDLKSEKPTTLPQMETPVEEAGSSLAVVQAEKLNWALQQHQIPEDWWNKRDLTGRNIKVALLSTGAELTLPDLAGVTHAFQYPSTDQTMQDLYGPGTQTAVLCSGTGQLVYGVAPEASLMIAKIGLYDNAITEEGLIAGLDWAINARADIVALLVDFSALQPSSEERLKALVKQALERNMLLLAPVGNSDNRKPEMRYPAAFEGVLSVGAHDQQNLRSNFSTRSYRLDFLAPGEGLLTLDSKGGRVKSGRSTVNATAYTAGFLALLCQGLRNKGVPVQPASVFQLLRDTCIKPRSLAVGDNIEYGQGLLNPQELLKHL